MKKTTILVLLTAFIFCAAIAVYSYDQNDYNALWNAVKAKDLKTAQDLLKKDPTLINVKNEDGESLLHEAVELGDVQLSKTFIVLGSPMDINAMNYEGKTPLHEAVMGKNDLVSLLVEKGANLNVKDDDGNTPLHLAAQNGYTPIVSCLINNGADINAKNEKGNTPLHLAAQAGRYDAVKELILRKADLNAKNNMGMTPSDLAFKNCYLEVNKLIMDNGGK